MGAARFVPSDSLPHLCRGCWTERSAHDAEGRCPAPVVAGALDGRAG